MSETTDLVVIEKTNALTVFKSSDQIEEILAKVEREVMSFVPDVSTAKGRKEIASLAYRVAQTKTYLDSLGKDLVAELKEIPKLIDGNRKTVRDRLDALKEKARQPLSDYEAEQERIKEAEAARIAAEKLAAEVETAHEMALLMNKEFDREAAEAKAEAERQRIAHEEEIKRQAIEQARQEAEAQAKRERDAATQREAQLIARAEQEKADRIAAQERAEREAKEALERTERLAKEAREQAEREKQHAIELAKRKAKEEADRIKREAEQKEAARLVEEKRIADEAAKREADVEHRRTINRQSVAELVGAGLPEDCAQKCVAAIAKGSVAAIRITY